MYPFEANSNNMHVADVRRNNPRLAMQGGIDKRSLVKGKKAIDKELEEKVPLVLQGGYIPHIDHAVPPDVSFSNYCYFRNLVQKLCETG